MVSGAMEGGRAIWLRCTTQLEASLVFLKLDQIAQIEAKLADIGPKYDRLLLTFTHRPFKTELALEYARHGYIRRAAILKRCIDNVFALIPPSMDEVPERSVLQDATINVQAFLANAYGSIDNLAWLWLYEQGLEAKISKTRVGFRAKHVEMRATLSDTFCKHLESLNDWFEYLIDYRDALAHRIPLYIPPGGVPQKNVDKYNDLSRQMTDALYLKGDPFEWQRLSAKQEKLLIFRPVITHSVAETRAHYVFHAQMIADFLTVEELGYKMLAELE